MVILNDPGLPEHPLAVGVTEITPVRLFTPKLLPTKEGIVPAPLEAKLIEEFEFVQLKVAPFTDEEKLGTETVFPLQIKIF
jgi:hypothetical protein